MSSEWIKHDGSFSCPLMNGPWYELKFAVDDIEITDCAEDWNWGRVQEYRPHEPSEQSEREDVSEAKPTKHPHYHKDVSHLSSIDVYRVLDLFGVTDQAIGHAAKKLLCAGQRGHKDLATDVQNVIDTLERWKEMRKEDNAV